jgi:hypothetical protein
MTFGRIVWRIGRHQWPFDFDFDCGFQLGGEPAVKLDGELRRQKGDPR